MKETEVELGMELPIHNTRHGVFTSIVSNGYFMGGFSSMGNTKVLCINVYV